MLLDFKKTIVFYFVIFPNLICVLLIVPHTGILYVGVTGAGVAGGGFFFRALMTGW